MTAPAERKDAFAAAVSRRSLNSNLACLAVKAAGLQSEAAADAYLRALRAAVITRRRNIARREVLLAVAVAGELAGGLGTDAALAALREDLKECRYRGVGRFPTLIVRRADSERGLVLTGYRPFEALLKATAGEPRPPGR